MLTLPTERIPAKTTNPRFLILYGKPKAGKTSAAAALDGNLIIDLEGGSEFTSAMAVQARSIEDLGAICQAIRQKNQESSTGFFYKHITIDNVTRLEEICLSYAVTLYQQTPMGKNYRGTDVRTLPNGSGYMYLRQAVLKVLAMFRELSPEFILVGHVKDKLINKDGEEMSEMALSLVGALADIVCGEADAVGYVYRKKNDTIVSFEGGDNSVREARAPHLAGKKIVLATSDEDNKITYFWNRIYI